MIITQLLNGARLTRVAIILLFLIGLWFFMTASITYFMAKKRNFEYAGLAFIPFCTLFILAKLSNDENRYEDDAESIERAALIFSILQPLSYVIPMLNVFIIPMSIMFILIGLQMLIFYKLFLLYKGSHAGLWTSLVVAIPLLLPFVLYSIKDTAPKYSPIEFKI